MSFYHFFVTHTPTQTKSNALSECIDYSSTFNIMQSDLLAEKLINLNVCLKLIVWLIDFLVKRHQVVRYHVLSQMKTTSTGAAQDTVLSPVLVAIILTILRAVLPCAVCTSTLMTLP